MDESVKLSKAVLLQIGSAMAATIDDSVRNDVVNVVYWGGLIDSPDEAVRSALRAELDNG